MTRGAVFCFCLLLPAVGRADLVLYRIPGINQVTALQGKATVHPGGAVGYTHPKYGTLYFDVADTKIYRVPTTRTLFQRKFRVAGKDPDKLMAAAQWALYNGLLDSFYDAVVAAYKINPRHPRAARVRELKRRIGQRIGDSSQQEAEMRKLVERDDMKIKTSAHFILMYDTPDPPPGSRKRSRAEDRLRLLESVYESFLLRFYSHGVDLEIPRERLKVVLFNERADYLHFVKRLSPSLQSSAGFWDGKNNTSVFYDQGSTESFKAIRRLSDQLQKMKEETTKMRARRRPVFRVAGRTLQLKDLARMADTFKLLVEINRENQDITVVSHEATHQLAGNTGLFPRHVMIPSWIHEGMASYFETPDDAAWSGIGAVNKQRLTWYRALEADRKHSNIDFITTDFIFDLARTHDSKLHAYGQGWALTHFLMERHFDKLMIYYRRIGEMPPDVAINPAVLRALFSEAFGQNRAKLDGQWRRYMRSLKTDMEVILAEK